jgi:hypothetical protein
VSRAVPSSARWLHSHLHLPLLPSYPPSLKPQGHLLRVGESRCAFIRPMVFANQAMATRTHMERQVQVRVRLRLYRFSCLCLCLFVCNRIGWVRLVQSPQEEAHLWDGTACVLTSLSVASFLCLQLHRQDWLAEAGTVPPGNGVEAHLWDSPICILMLLSLPSVCDTPSHRTGLQRRAQYPLAMVLRPTCGTAQTRRRRRP